MIVILWFTAGIVFVGVIILAIGLADYIMRYGED